jgi:hypothetical protein
MEVLMCSLGAEKAEKKKKGGTVAAPPFHNPAALRSVHSRPRRLDGVDRARGRAHDSDDGRAEEVAHH